MNDNQIIKEWFRYAHNDLIVAHHSFEDLYPKQTEIACYHCQQCAEKALKGYLIFKDIEPPRIHDLIKLCQMCIEYDSQFHTILDCCIVLNKKSPPQSGGVFFFVEEIFCTCGVYYHEF
jgi:HEPN domain-containing protein